MQDGDSQSVLSLSPAQLTQNMGLQLPKHTQRFSAHILVKRLPWLGSLHFIWDQEGILSLTFVVFYWVYNVCTTFFMILQPQWAEGRIATWFVIYYLTLALLCLIALFRAVTLNPGRVPLIDEMHSQDVEGWIVCQRCQRKRPNRAHHCRRCGQCVLRMDHHCPWINNCVGEGNHYQFMLLLIYAFLLSANTFLIAMAHFWYLPKCETCDREAFHIKHSLLFLYLSVVMAVLMSMSMTTQCLAQHFNILLNKTTMETMGMGTMSSANIKVVTFYAAYSELFGTRNILLWPFPCRRRRSTAFVMSHAV